jgi:predicted nucleotidyltransferase
MKHWQERMLDNLASYFESDQDVLGLLLFGSLSQPDFHPDTWSDIDVLVIVKDGKLDRFFPATQWITSFGNLYTYSQSAGDFSNTTRVCFENFNRVDFVFTTEGRLADIDRWPGIPFSSGAKVMFARSQIIEKLARQTYPRKSRHWRHTNSSWTSFAIFGSRARWRFTRLSGMTC